MASLPTKIVTVGETEVTLVERNDERTGLMIFNLTETVAAAAGDAVIYISDHEVTTDNGYAIPPKGFIVLSFDEGFDPRKKYHVISSTATTFVTVLEEFLKTKKGIPEEEAKEDIQDVAPKDPSM